MTQEALKDRFIFGWQAIADEIGKTKSATQWMERKGRIKLGRAGAQPVADREVLRQQFTELASGKAR